MFIGCGTIERLIEFDDLEQSERKLCEMNNWYGKILFGILIKFLPAVSSAADQPVLQTGSQIAASEIDRISAMASARIVS